MKKYKYWIIALVVIVLVCSLLFVLVRKNYLNNSTNKRVRKKISLESSANYDIKEPDRMVFKSNDKYYEIKKEETRFEKLVEICENGIYDVTEDSISEKEINNLKENNDFVEFDYDRVSKNYIFFFDSDVGVIKMDESDGTIISDEFDEDLDIFEEFEKAVKNKDSYEFESEKIVSKNNYESLPSTFDFTPVKSEKVYKMELKSYNEYKVIAERYNLDFGKNDIEEKFENSKVILFLSKYKIADYKVNVGNIKIIFKRK